MTEWRVSRKPTFVEHLLLGIAVFIHYLIPAYDLDFVFFLQMRKLSLRSTDLLKVRQLVRRLGFDLRVSDFKCSFHYTNFIVSVWVQFIFL